MINLVIGISGASGAIYGVRLLQMLQGIDGVTSHLVVSGPGYLNIAHETGLDKKSVLALADHSYKSTDIGARIASGSANIDGMIIAPCSVKTLAAIASGYTDNLLSRAADVCLKERRRLALMVRESPLHLGHIRNMAAVTEYGAIIYPPAPPFYARPTSLDDMIDQTNAKLLDGFGIDVTDILQRWEGM